MSTIEENPADTEACKRRERIIQLKKKKEKKIDNVTVSLEDNSNTIEVDDDLGIETHASDSNEGIMKMSDDEDISNMTSRKIDWDLKKGIKASLDILQERTNEIIMEIISEQEKGKNSSDS